LGEPDQGSRLDPRHCPRGEFLCDAQVHDRSVALRNVEVGYLVDEGDYVYPFDNPDSLEIQRVWEPPQATSCSQRLRSKTRTASSHRRRKGLRRASCTPPPE
jgi:hypothetical protein